MVLHYVLCIDDEGSLAVQFEQVEVVSKGDPPPDEPDDGDSALGTSLHTSDKSKTITSKSETATAHQVITLAYLGIYM